MVLDPSHYDVATPSDWAQDFGRLFFAIFAALPLGRIAQWLHLPIITGFLVIGILEGPSVAGVVRKTFPTEVYSYVIRQFALSYIAYQAGCEVYFPEIRRLLKDISIQLAAVYIGRYLGTFFIAWGIRGLLPFTSGITDESCIFSQQALLASLICISSPSAIIALIFEFRAKGALTKIALGITVLLDIVCVIIFSIVIKVTYVMCPQTKGEVLTFEPAIIGMLIATILLGVAMGVVLGIIIILLLTWPMERDAVVGGHAPPTPLWITIIQGALILLIGAGVFVGTDYLEEYTLEYSAQEVTVEPLLVNIIATIVAGHWSETVRHRLHRIMDTVAPWIFLPFFVVTGIVPVTLSSRFVPIT